MARVFLERFSGQAFTEGQLLAFQFEEKKLLTLSVKRLEAADLSALKTGEEPIISPTKMGRCLGDTQIQFEKAEGSQINLIGKARG